MTVHYLPRRDMGWTFGDRVRKVRRVAHLTQKQLGAILDVGEKSIDAWEADRNKPRDLLATAQRIEDEFDLPRGWMLGYADGPTSGPGQWAPRGSNPQPTVSGFGRGRLALVS